MAGYYYYYYYKIQHYLYEVLVKTEGNAEQSNMYLMFL